MLKDSSHNKQLPPSFAEAFGAYQAIEREWKMSQHYRQLEGILATVDIPSTLTKIIGFCLGPIIIGSQVLEHRVVQHALISALDLTLTQRGNLSGSSRRYVQDPAYARQDMDVLQSAGLTILQDPQGLLELDESSVLVSINSNFPIKEVVADICRPGIIIWDKGEPNPPTR
jgi:hypothetical protein